MEIIFKEINPPDNCPSKSQLHLDIPAIVNTVIFQGNFDKTGFSVKINRVFQSCIEVEHEYFPMVFFGENHGVAEHLCNITQQDEIGMTIQRELLNPVDLIQKIKGFVVEMHP